MKTTSTDRQLVAFVERMMDDQEWMEGIPPERRSQTMNRRWFGKGRSSPRRDGRIGLDLLDGWHPGLFVGVLVDATNHGVLASVEEKGPDFCLIVDMEYALHDLYADDPSYLQFLRTLKERICGTKWQLLNHVRDHPTPNRWHPIHVRRPLLDVVGTASTAEEQLESLKKAGSEVLRFVLDEDFWRLREHLEARVGETPFRYEDEEGSKGLSRGLKGAPPSTR